MTYHSSDKEPRRRTRPAVAGIVLALAGSTYVAFGVGFGALGGFSADVLIAIGAIHLAAGATVLAWPRRSTALAAIGVAAIGGLLALGNVIESLMFLRDPSAGLVSVETGLAIAAARATVLVAYLFALQDLASALTPTTESRAEGA